MSTPAALAETLTLTVERASNSTNGLPQRAHFLEHVALPHAQGATTQVIAGLGTNIYESRDLGVTWEKFELGTFVSPDVMRCFSLHDGTHLLQLLPSFRMVLVNSAYRFIQECEVGQFPWHGSWSIDQSSTETIMYGEYADAAEALHVWRSDDGGRTWRIAMTKSGTLAAEPAIRHFHLCQADPFVSGRWIVSSGDSAPHCRMWASLDDGTTWAEIADPIMPVQKEKVGIVPKRLRCVYRYTAITFTEETVLWGTDDLLGKDRSALVAASREAPHILSTLAELGPNEIRGLVALDGGHGVAIAQARASSGQAEVFAVNTAGAVQRLAGINNFLRKPTPFIKSMCSRRAHGGVFFSYDDGILDGQSRTLRWAVSREARADDPQEECPTVTGCNICQPDIRTALDRGATIPPKSSDGLESFKVAGQIVDYVCDVCRSRARMRVMDVLLSQARSFIPVEGRCLAISCGRIEMQMLQKLFTRILHVSLHGAWNDPQCVTGVDIRKMPDVPSGAFSFAVADCVLDYIPELDLVFREMARILLPGGVFIFCIQPWRLSDDETATVKVVDRNALRSNPYVQFQDNQTGVPNCVFGRSWLMATCADAGFKLDRYLVQDPISDLDVEWYMARRLPDLN